MELIIAVVIFVILIAFVVVRIKKLNDNQLFIGESKDSDIVASQNVENVLITTFKKPTIQPEVEPITSHNKEIVFEKYMPPANKPSVLDNVLSEYNTPKKVSVITTEKKTKKSSTGGKKSTHKQVVKLNKNNVVKYAASKPAKSQPKSKVKPQEIVKDVKPKKVRTTKKEKTDTTK